MLLSGNARVSREKKVKNKKGKQNKKLDLVQYFQTHNLIWISAKPDQLHVLETGKKEFFGFQTSQSKQKGFFRNLNEKKLTI